MREIKLKFDGRDAIIVRPENPNGKWIWKTEFLYAFDQAEVELCKDGYTRVYYSVSNKYGSYQAIRLMHRFHLHIIKELQLEEKCFLFGFSRGGLYAFNYALTYPEYVEKVYLDAPVLDMRSWPWDGSEERDQVYKEFDLTPETLKVFKGHPIENLEEYFVLNIPTLLVAGDSDEIVPFEENALKMINYCKEHNIPLEYYVKPNCKHHPHSLEDDISPIIKFIKNEK